MLVSEINKEILDKPCVMCEEEVSNDVDSIMTFYRGEFVRLHSECQSFLLLPRKAPRGTQIHVLKGMVVQGKEGY